MTNKQKFEVEAYLVDVQHEIANKLGVRVKLSYFAFDDDGLGVYSVPPEELVKVVYKTLGVDPKIIKEKNRKREVIIAKHASFLLLKEAYPSIKLEETATIFKMHHTAIVNGKDAARNRLYTQDFDFVESYKKAKSAVNQFVNDFKKSNL